MTSKLLIGLLVWLMMAGLLVADEISVTVYNKNLGVVHETRVLEFNKGIGKLSFVDVPYKIDATSVGFKVVND